MIMTIWDDPVTVIVAVLRLLGLTLAYYGSDTNYMQGLDVFGGMTCLS